VEMFGIGRGGMPTSSRPRLHREWIDADSDRPTRARGGDSFYTRLAMGALLDQERQLESGGRAAAGWGGSQGFRYGRCARYRRRFALRIRPHTRMAFSTRRAQRPRSLASNSATAPARHRAFVTVYSIEANKTGATAANVNDDNTRTSEPRWRRCAPGSRRPDRRPGPPTAAVHSVFDFAQRVA